MRTQIFVNLPVKDLKRSMEFFTRSGLSFNPKFSNEDAGCLVISDSIFVMLLTSPKFEGFLPPGRTVADATKTTEVMLALSFETKELMHAFADRAFAAGATEARPPEDLGFMCTRSFADLDGHVWEPFWMDPNGMG